MTEGTPPTPERIPTGIPGLDTILHGGFLQGRAYMVMGLPGAGKTILASQTCFHHVSKGGRVLYVTLLAESHTDLLANLRPMRFFDASRIPERIAYLSAYTVLEEGGLEALLELLRKEVRQHRASLLVLDGLVAAEEVAPSTQAVKRFIHGIQIITRLMGCTTLLLTTGGGQGLRAEHTMVDGLLLLRERTYGVRVRRDLYVRKFRGSAHLRGRHSFDITDEGIAVYPRLETLVGPGVPPHVPVPLDRQPFGIAGLDKMLYGGLLPGATTMLLGNPGSGKTLLGLHFLAEGARRGERGHYFAFYDPPSRVLVQAANVGLDLKPFLERGDLELSFRMPTESLLDKLGAELLSAIRERGVRRIFLDGFDALQRVAFHPARTARFLAALVNACRLHNVTLLYSVETKMAFGPELSFPVQGISMIAENLLLLRTVELRSEFRRFIGVLKIRGSGFDPSLRELVISDRGMKVGKALSDGQMLVTGMGRTSAPSRSPLRRLLKRRGT